MHGYSKSSRLQRDCTFCFIAFEYFNWKMSLFSTGTDVGENIRSIGIALLLQHHLNLIIYTQLYNVVAHSPNYKKNISRKKAATMDYFYSIFFFYTNMLLVLLWLVLLLFIVNFLISFPLAGGILKKSTNKRIKFTAAENKWKPSSPKRHMHTFTLRDRTTTKEFSYHHTQFSHDIAISEEC